MTQAELQRRLQMAGYEVWDRPFPRFAARVLNDPQKGRPVGRPGQRNYSELDLRRMVAWLRVHELCGEDSKGLRLRREAVELLARNTWGYVWISDSQVGWSALPPVGVLRNGVATCWPVQE